MESRWYVPPGQSLENTSFSNRTHALHVSASAWKKITGHLDRKRLIAEGVEKEAAHKRALKEGSDAMAKNWPNSIQNHHIRVQEERKKRLEELEQKRKDNYNVLAKEQEQLRDEYIKNVKKRMFYEKSYPRELNGALLESEVLYERQKQQEFQKMIDAHNEEVEREWADNVRQATVDYEREKQEQASQSKQKKQEIKDMYLKSIEDKERLEMKIKTRQMRKEEEDYMRAQAEMELQQQMEREDIIRERKELKAERLFQIEKDKETKRLLQKEDDEVEEVTKVFERVKQDIECIRKEKLAEIRAQEVAKRDRISQMCGVEDKAKEESYQRYVQRGMEDMEQREVEKEEARLEKQRQQRRDIEEAWAQSKQRKEKEEKMAYELKKWEMLNRLKGEEAAKQHDQDQRKESFEEKLKYGMELKEDIEARKQGEDKSKKLMAEFMRIKVQKEDEEFFNYANELIEYAKKNDRPTYPIVKVVEKYKKENHIGDDGNPNARKCEPYVQQDKMMNTTPGKRQHHPRCDPNYRRCPCHKDEIIK